LSTSTPRRAQPSPFIRGGNLVRAAREVTDVPIDDSTMKSGPSMPAMVLALAGDSTMTRALPMGTHDGASHGKGRPTPRRRRGAGPVGPVRFSICGP